MASYLGKSPARLAIITDDTITSAKIVDNTVTSADILNATITGADLASDISISTSGNLTTSGAVDTDTICSNGLALVASDGNNIARFCCYFGTLELQGGPTNCRIFTLSGPDIRFERDATVCRNAIVTSDLTVDTNTLHVDSSNNRVGIGTTTPGTNLQIVGSLALGSDTVQNHSSGDITGVGKLVLGGENNANGTAKGRLFSSSNTLKIQGGTSGLELVGANGDTHVNINCTTGAATFNCKIILGTNKLIEFGDSGENISGDGTNLTIASSQNLILDTANELKLDSTVGINLLDNGTSYGLIVDASGDLVITSKNLNLLGIVDNY